MWLWYGRDVTDYVRALFDRSDTIGLLTLAVACLGLWLHQLKVNRKLRKKSRREPLTKKVEPPPIPTQELSQPEKERLEIEMTRLLEGPPGELK